MFTLSRNGRKSTVLPIALPYDGPISHFMFSQNNIKTEARLSFEDLENGIVEFSENILEGSSLFLFYARVDVSKSIDSVPLYSNINLLHSLIHATHIHEQLQALHKFRNKTIQNQRRLQKRLEHDIVADKILYRILLEWMISVHTPVNLRRAVASCLSVLIPPQTQDNGDIDVKTDIDIPFDVLKSILQPAYQGGCQLKYWLSPLHSLFEILSLGYMEEALNTETWIVQILKFLRSQCNTESQAFNLDQEINLMSNLINKILIMESGQNIGVFQTLKDMTLNDIFSDLQLYFWSSLLRHDVPIDRLSNIGIAYGRSIKWQLRNECPAANALLFNDILERVSMISSALKQAAVLQGLSVVVLIHSTSVLELMGACKQIFVEAVDPDARCLALKGVRSLISRIHTWYSNTKNMSCSVKNGSPEFTLDIDVVRPLVDEILHAVLQAWENPPTKKLANAIPALFENLIQLTLLISVEKSLDELVERLLVQAPNLKGRYLALETMLPIVGATRIVQSNSCLLHNLLVGIGDQGHNTGVIADLWAELLKQLLIDYSEQLHKESRSNDDGLLVSSDWLELWSSSLAYALCSKDLTRRKQVAAFCLPRVFAMEFKNASRPELTSAIFNSLLESVEQLSLDGRASYDRQSAHGETIHDRVLWAELEIIRYASADGLLKKSSEFTKKIREKVAATLPRMRLQSVLVHNLPAIRVSALQVMGYVVGTYSMATASPLDFVRWEVEMWMFALPSLVKTDENEYVVSVHQCLLLFLDRLLLTEASSCENNVRNPSRPLPLFHSFVVDFLIHDVILKRTGYPGTVALKENFLLSLMEGLIVFSLRDHPLAADSKLIPKTLSVFRRRRLDIEDAAIVEIKKALSSSDVFDCLETVLHSMWDSSRNGAYRTLVSLVFLCNVSRTILPGIGTDSSFRNRLLSKGIFLASSPRQREADTGAKLISFIYISLSSMGEKRDLLCNLVDLLDRRLTCMKEQLATLHSCFEHHTQTHHLPLAYGIVHTLRLVTESNDLPLSAEQSECRDDITGIFDRMISLFFRAIQVSLAVVADVHDGEIISGMDELTLVELESTKATGMVNPSAIGANGIFSSVKWFSSSENYRRLASQRIVIGSWLLTKETCAAIASFLSLSIYKPSPAVYDNAGVLLISTLTSLKHTGAAFAAHRALQLLAQICFSRKSIPIIHDLPKKWGKRLIAEVSDSEKIRDSILRRSTGYCLGFLSLMRAEVSVRNQYPLCHLLLRNTLQLCLPSNGQWNEFASNLQLSERLKTSFFPICVQESHITVVSDDHFCLQARVHALNILRACLLDAPIANEIFPFVGFAFIASMIGYTDSEWSVRNSSTMVFAAAMLRSIDPDKNSVRADVTGRNTITADELFRSYPPLAPFLLAVLNGCSLESVEVQQTLSLPPILPILLLLSRIQPLSLSGETSIIQIEPFVPFVFKFLSHRHISIRSAAARAIRNMMSGKMKSSTCIHSILSSLQQDISLFTNFNSVKGSQWNYLHGLLLTLHELVEYFSEAKIFVRAGKCFENLYVLAALYDGLLMIPYLCSLMAIKVIWQLTQNHDCSRLLLVCTAITSHLEQSHRLDLYDTGSAKLGAEVAMISTRILSSTLLGCTASIREKGTALDSISLLIQSDCIDVRFASVKTFKKLLRHFIESQSIGNLSSDQFYSIAESLHTAVDHELRRNLCVGAHSPTLRRLSRCLLDWLVYCPEMEMSDERMNLNSRLVNVARSLLKNGSSDRCPAFDPNSFPQLDGNALELLGVKGVPLSVEDQQMLVQSILRLSSPSCHWKLRLSASIAMHRLSDMLMEDNAMSSSPHMVNLLSSLFTLLQDEDYDVRQAVANATSKLSCFLGFNASIVDVDIAQECNVLATPSSSMGCCLFTLLYGISSDIEGRLRVLIDELIQSATSDIFPTLVKETVLRAIFESEKPNSFIEMCLLCQMVVVSILTMAMSVPFHANGNLFLDSTNAFLEYVYSVLTLLYNYTSDITILFSVTRSNVIFPCLHNLLLTTLTLIYVDEASFVPLIGNIKFVATNIISVLAGVGSLDCIHPLVLETVQALSNAEQLDTDTMNTLKKCCFLIQKEF